MSHGKSATTMMVVIVADDACIREPLCRFMEREGYRTSAVADGEAALTMVAKVKPDLVVIKKELRGMGGCETCRAVRQLPAGEMVPIIMLVEETSLVAEAIASGATDVILTFQNLELLAERARCLLRVFVQMRELLETQTRMKQALRIARLGNWEWDPRGDRLWLSEEMCGMFHLEKRDTLLSYEQFLSAIYAPDRQLVNDNLRHAVLKRAATTMEFRIKRPNGTLGTVTLRGEPGDCVEQGGYPRLCGILQDVTERGQQEGFTHGAF